VLWSGFREDRRYSMDVYVGELSKAFQEQPELGYDLAVHVPHLPQSLRSTPSGMRLARYVHYPWTARRQDAEIHHVAEPGYSQLLYTLRPGKAVVTVHDMAPVVRWRGGIPGVEPGRKPWLNLLSARALARAAHLIAISEYTRRELLEHCACDRDRITVIHHGIEGSYHVLSEEERPRARRKWSLPADGTRRVLFFGSSYRKNQRVALEAFAALRGLIGARLQLIGIGVAGESWRADIRRLGLEACSREIAEVPAGEMMELYNCVDVLLFPSLHEGFGRPPLEAMACGVPVVASNAAALPEAIGDAGLMCAPSDVVGLAGGLRDALFDPELRQRLVERGLARARQFTWHETARRTARVYDRVLSGQ
jgi:glycosyltransferase involved in cell wall biosynthesis